MIKWFRKRRVARAKKVLGIGSRTGLNVYDVESEDLDYLASSPHKQETGWGMVSFNDEPEMEVPDGLTHSAIRISKRS